MQTSTYIINQLTDSIMNKLTVFCGCVCAQGGFLHPRRGEGGRFLHVLQSGFAAEGGRR